MLSLSVRLRPHYMHVKSESKKLLNHCKALLSRMSLNKHNNNQLLLFPVLSKGPEVPMIHFFDSHCIPRKRGKDFLTITILKSFILIRFIFTDKIQSSLP